MSNASCRESIARIPIRGVTPKRSCQISPARLLDTVLYPDDVNVVDDTLPGSIAFTSTVNPKNGCVRPLPIACSKPKPKLSMPKRAFDVVEDVEVADCE